jgi:hypothetical protein
MNYQDSESFPDGLFRNHSFASKGEEYVQQSGICSFKELAEIGSTLWTD